MRVKFYSLILFVITLSVSPLIAQTQYQTVSGEPYKLVDGSNSKSQVFYSEGKVYVAPNASDATEATLFVQGSMLFKEGAKVTQQGVTALTGDFVLLNTSAKNTDTARKYLFDLNDLSLSSNNFFNPEGYKSNINDYFNKGVVKFVGKYNQQDIYALYSSVTNPTVTDFKLNINSEERQLGFIANFPKIQMDKDTYVFTTGTPNFDVDGMPILDVSKFESLSAGTSYDPRKAGFVNVNDNVAVSINQLELYGCNRFKANANSQGLVSQSATADKATWYKLNYSYLDINKLVGDTKVGSAGSIGGYSEFGMRLYDYTANVDDAQTDSKVIETNTYNIPNAQMPYTPGENVQSNATFLRGLTSPFETLRADYLYFHVLSKPNQYSPDSYEGVIAPPDTEVKKGEAYYFAMDASRQYFDNILDKQSLPAQAWKNRARGGLDFSRFLRTYDVNKLIRTNTEFAHLNVRSANPSASDYEAQRFISSNVEVDINVRESTNDDVTANVAGSITLLANPYLTPINLTPILDGGVTATQSFPIKYGTVEMPKAKAVTEITTATLQAAKTANELLLRSRYWVMNTGLILSSDANKYYYNIKYDLIDKDVAASTVTDPLKRVIQPLQVFAIQSATSGKFTFMPEMKVAIGKPIETVFKSDFATRALDMMTEEDVDSNEEEVIPDWFFIQSLSKDGGDFSVDRTAVRFFSDGKVNYDGMHDVVKNIAYNPSLDTKSSETLTKQGRSAVDAAKQEIRPYNVLYTEKTKNVPLIASSGKAGLTKELPLYYLPAKDKEEVTLSFYGLDGLDQIKQVYLVDRHELDSNNKPVRMKLEEGSVYSFTSYSETETVEKANRFILLFDEEDDDNSLIISDSPISTYYSGSTLYINGLTNKDISSVVQIFDMQGRLMGSTKVNNYPTMEYFKPLGLGTFIVKIVGARNYDSKFVNTQNY